MFERMYIHVSCTYACMYVNKCMLYIRTYVCMYLGICLCKYMCIHVESSGSTTASTGARQAVYFKALRQPFLKRALGQLVELAPQAEPPTELAEATQSEQFIDRSLYIYFLIDILEDQVSDARWIHLG